MLNADTSLKTVGRKLVHMPVGTILHFTVSFHDDVGQQFQATNTVVKYRPNR